LAATKTCPSCAAEVPVSADRCKECFHDFTEPPRRNLGPIALLGAFAAMAVFGALTFWYLSSRPLDTHILVNDGTRSIEWVTQYRSGPRTERLRWDDISRLEHVTLPNGDFEIAAITTTGDRVVFEESAERPLKMTAEHYAALMDKPLDDVDKTRGFHKLREQE